MAVNLPVKTPGGSSVTMRSLDAVSAENDNLIEQVKTMGLALEAKEERLRSLMGEVSFLRREAERGKKNAKYDLVAREGQTKRLGILEHTVTTLRHDLGINVERRQKVEEKMTVLERSWQNERSLRLQDLHRHDAMSSGTKHAERAAIEAEGKWLAAEDKARMLQIELETRSREMQSQTRISEANESEIDAQAAEIELHKTEILALKKTLCARDADISAECTRSSNLRRELSRVRRDYIVSTHNRSEKQSALLGGRKKNRNNSANSGVRRRASLVRDLSASSSACAPARVTATSTDICSIPGRVTIAASSIDKCKQQALSGLESSALQEPRKRVSLDDVFVSKIKVDGASSSKSLAIGGSSSVLDDNSKETSIERAHRAPLLTSSGFAKVNVDDRPEQTFESKLQECKGGRSRANPGNNPGSTLLVPGSLYVGTGLGFKNTPVWVPPGGSAKDKLKHIMEDKSNSCNQAATIVHDVHRDNSDDRD